MGDYNFREYFQGSRAKLNTVHVGILRYVIHDRQSAERGAGEIINLSPATLIRDMDSSKDVINEYVQVRLSKDFYRTVKIGGELARSITLAVDDNLSKLVV